MALTSQSKPSCNPLPAVADVSWILHWRSLMDARPSASDICAAFRAPFISCLFANTRRIAFSRSDSCNHSTALVWYVEAERTEKHRVHFLETRRKPYLQHGVKFRTGSVHALRVRGVHNKYNGVCIRVVTPPVGPDRTLHGKGLSVSLHRGLELYYEHKFTQVELGSSACSR
jgi:hypothetical protein